LKTIIVTEAEFLAVQAPIMFDQLSITMGVFDGLHRGHQALFKQAVQVAQQQNLKSAVVSFDFSHVALKKRDNHLLTGEETEDILGAQSFDYHIIIQFGPTLVGLSPDRYLDTLTTVLRISAITVGTDFSFGKNRAGDVALLAAYGPKYNYTVYTVPLVEQQNTRISSRDIEQLLRTGDVEAANALLGYTYALCGVVIHGEQKGRQLGYPTANMMLPAGKVVLPYGVYITRVCIEGKSYDAVTNIGISPTIKTEDTAIVETHIFDFSADIYGAEIIVYFYDRIRDEKKFNSIEALKEQMARDTVISKKYLAKLANETIK